MNNEYCESRHRNPIREITPQKRTEENLYLTEHRNEDINGYCHIVEQTLPAFELAAVLPTLNRFVRLPIVRKLVMPTAEDKSGVGMLMGYVLIVS